MKIIGASFLILSYLSIVGATYYYTGGNTEVTGNVSGGISGLLAGFIIWKFW
jgi:hypothetical protein